MINKPEWTTDKGIPFVGRRQELRTLTQFYQQDRRGRGAEFLLLYGRKGTGKMRLLQEFVQKQQIVGAFYWQAPGGAARMQLQDFTQTVRLFAPQVALPENAFADWRDALDCLAQIAEQTESLFFCV